MTTSRELEGRRAALSPEKLAALQQRIRGGKRHVASSIPTAFASQPIPLSFAQERIWLHQQLVPGSVVYNRPANIRLRGPLNVDAIRSALNDTLARHDSVWSSVADNQSEATLLTQSPIDVEIPLIDLATEPDPAVSAAEMTAHESKQPFDLSAAPLFRSRLLRLGEDDHLLLLTFHHFCFDAWSQSVLLQQLTTAYEQIARHTSMADVKPIIEYGDFAAWDRSAERVETLRCGPSYWKRELENPPALQLPTDSPRSASPTEVVATAELNLPARLVEQIRRLARQEDSTLFTTVLAAFQTLLYRYTGQQDIVVGCPMAGRTRVEFEELIGVFINTLPMRVRLDGDETFRQLLQRVKQSVMSALEFQDVPLQFVAEDVLRERDASGSPLFQAMFIHENLSVKLQPVAGVVFEPVDRPAPATMVDLSLELMETDDGVTGRLNYRHELWEQTTIERLVGHFETLLAGIAADADLRISELPLLTAEERRQLLVEWNDTATDYPRDKCVHQLFEEQVERTPDAVAVVFEEQQLTYRELNERANQLAHHLRSQGVESETLVGLCLERSPELVIGILGILKAGGAYVPLDADYPMQRLEFMLQDAAVAHLVTNEPLLDKLPVFNGCVTRLDRDTAALVTATRSNPKVANTPEKLAYVMYTSGSTGTPKGVAIRHTSVANFLLSMAVAPGMTPSDRLLGLTTPTFDISVLELLLPLTLGAAVVVLPSALALDGAGIAAAFLHYDATAMQATPATWQMMVQSGWKGLPQSKLLWGGEALPDHLAVELRRRCNELWNMYGPTETTIWSTTRQLKSPEDCRSIGRPIANTQVYVLDSRRNLLPIGVPGELYIGGAGLARGYLNRPDLTAEKFVANPFSDDPDSRLYRTGDLCRWRADGNLEFLGRIDHQVKLRGFRIELGEIEAALGEQPQVAQCAVVLREDRPGEKRLVAYCVPAAKNVINISELRDQLRQRLPDYLLPAVFVTQEALPLTPSGKVDRRGLPEPDASRPDLENTYVAPRTRLEEQLAAIWCELLGLERVGIHDEFFALGGHSLLAVRLFTRIEESHGERIPLAVLFQQGTIAQLSRLLTTSGTVEAEIATTISLSSCSRGRSLFMMPSIGGELLYSRQLIEKLGRRYPLVGVQPALDPRNEERFVDFRSTAAGFLAAIRTHQPEGPYALAGYSYGGLMAYEVACQLADAGEEVDLLAVIDTGPAWRGMLVPMNERVKNVTRIAANSPNWLREELRDFSAGRLLDSLRRKVRYLSKRVVASSRPAIELDDRFDVSRIPTQNRDLMRTVFAAFRDWMPRPYAGNLTLLRATTRPLLRPATPDLGWARFVGELDILEIHGNHESILKPPYVDELARQLEELLEPLASTCSLKE